MVYFNLTIMEKPTKPGDSDKSEVLFSKYDVSVTLDVSNTLHSIKTEVENHVKKALDVSPNKVDVPEVVWNTNRGKSTVKVTVNGYTHDESMPYLEATIHNALEDNWTGFEELHNVTCIEMVES